MAESVPLAAGLALLFYAARVEQLWAHDIGTPSGGIDAPSPHSVEMCTLSRHIWSSQGGSLCRLEAEKAGHRTIAASTSEYLSSSRSTRQLRYFCIAIVPDRCTRTEPADLPWLTVMQAGLPPVTARAAPIIAASLQHWVYRRLHSPATQGLSVLYSPSLRDRS